MVAITAALAGGSVGGWLGSRAYLINLI